MENKKEVFIKGLVLIAVFMVGFFATSLLLEQNTVDEGVIYLKPDEIQYAPGLKDKTGATVIVIGLLDETFDSMVPTIDLREELDKDIGFIF